MVSGTPYAGVASMRVNAERISVLEPGVGVRTASPKLLEGAAGLRTTPSPLVYDPAPNHASGLESLSSGISPRPGFGSDEIQLLCKTPPRRKPWVDESMLIKGSPASRPKRQQQFHVGHTADPWCFAGTTKQLQPTAPGKRMYRDDSNQRVAEATKRYPIGHSLARDALPPAGLKRELPSLYCSVGDLISHSSAPFSQAELEWTAESRGKYSPAPQRREMLSEDHPPGRCQSTPSISSGFNSYDGGGRVRQRVVRSPSLRSLRGTAYGGASATATSAAESRASTPPPRWRRVGGGPPSPSSSRARTLTPPPTWERQGAAASRTPTTSSNCTSYGAVRSCFPKQSSWSPSDVVSMAGSL
mmetsp:Transcript_37222/g.73746  ORF Transcript_37222/g.73746 Transcript_37222/m.73746 type:complete len:358 (+) Transcript_37222:203-1276(+)